MKTIKIGLAALAICSVSAKVDASPILAEYQDGDTYAFDGWVGSEDPYTSDTQPSGDDAVGGIDINGGAGVDINSTGENAIQIEESSAGSTPTDVFYTSSFGANRDVSGFAGLSFDFYATDNAPAAIGFYFESSTDDTIWYYDISSSFGTGTWDNYTASFDYYSGWRGYSWDGSGYGEYGSAALAATAFGNALGDVDALGFYITYNSTGAGNNEYGIDDFGLTVPEPETYMVLGMAMLTVAFVFRRRVSDSLAQARSMMQM